MARQLSTSFSDLVLSASSFYICYLWYLQGHKMAAAGFGILGSAAFLGIFRFAMTNPEGTLIFKCHKFLSFLSAGAGVSLVAMEFCGVYGSVMLANKIAIFLMIVIGAAAFMPPKMRGVCTQAASGFSMLTILILCFINKNYYGIIAGLLYVVSGLLLTGDGILLGFPYVDWLHYVLTAANFLFLKALK
ncbi:hypothetical protein FSP39_024830 [Pinctada imbricata]|uniref:Uncharacterized protein n=1 Tax=Pinctada imbricata TaxID=66713 RepID=A0AA89BY19_PINIB|nr:hypothetical protein FSP39_024830 [Pinctada imbricata]